VISLTNFDSTTTQKLQAFLSGAAATTNPTVTVESYIVGTNDKPDFSDYAEAPQFTVLAGATETDIASAPEQGCCKKIPYIGIFNADTASVTVTVCIDVAGTYRILIRATLATLESLYYEDGRGWYSVDANGAEKVSGLTYTEGSWTPVFTFNTPGDLDVVYSTQVGRYIRVGDEVTAWFNIITSTFTHTTASGNAQITGLPFTPINITGFAPRSTLQWSRITKANYTDISASISPNSTMMTLVACGSGQATANVTAADMPTAGTLVLVGQIIFETA
jgi:hypothetical protein